MRTLKGPGVFLAQFIGSEPPFETLDGLARWAADLGYVGVQIPCGGPESMFDLGAAAASQTYCDDVAGRLGEHGLVITELSTHLQGQLVAVHPAYDLLFNGFAADPVRGDPSARQAWAVDQVKSAAIASRRLGLTAHATFSGSLAWPYLYPWPQRPAGLIDQAFAELGRRWRPILDAFEEEGVDLCFEIHPGEDLHDGATWERFLATVDDHPRANILYDPSHFVLQQLDYLDFIDRYHDRIRAFHVKDAEFRPPGARASTAVIRTGWIALAGSVRRGMGRSISGRCSPSSRPTAIQGGRCSSGSAPSRAPSRAQREGATFIRDHIISGDGARVRRLRRLRRRCRREPPSCWGSDRWRT